MNLLTIYFFFSRCAKFYAPLLVNRMLYSEILDKWFKIPCTNRAMDLIDDAFGLDYYILQVILRVENTVKSFIFMLNQ